MYRRKSLLNPVKKVANSNGVRRKDTKEVKAEVAGEEK